MLFFFLLKVSFVKLHTGGGGEGCVDWVNISSLSSPPALWSADYTPLCYTTLESLVKGSPWVVHLTLGLDSGMGRYLSHECYSFLQKITRCYLL